MIRTNSAKHHARRSVGAVGVLVAAAALTACGGSPAHQGAAAVVGGQRITIATVEAKVSALRDAVGAEPGAPRPERAGLTKRAVADLVLDRVVAQALSDHRLDVTETEIAQARESDAKLLGGESELQRELLFKQGVATGDLDAFYRQQLGIHKLAAADGKDARTAEGDAAIRKALAEAGTELRIVVNPRYGSWDPEQVTLVDTGNDWLPQRGTSI
ncbi:SurA N-terminal domain-containing protein [Kitasatospora sp. GP82]|uniref:SurA N-terminal domain-containing protein n=1 Tax=Kitasatospora sp. GP82 TaxID=3035089 RepID=UPI0024764659|nr:SurA N-terminal domain-containing protein [Kitasatospora sp. GP82]MDH6123090.1 phage I-like protein [Kitasatospora sp. GP82]